jgi:hypothetical protein
MVRVELQEELFQIHLPMVLPSSVPVGSKGDLIMEILKWGIPLMPVNYKIQNISTNNEIKNISSRRFYR